MHDTIAIIGAGMAGLMLARVLHLHGVEAEVYEAEAGEGRRPQGGLLDLSEDQGQAALRAADLHDGFLRLVRRGEDAKRVTDKAGRTLLDRPGGGTGGRPEVDRGDLRRLLLRSLPAGTVRWGHKVAAVEIQGDGRRWVGFENGRSVACGLLVGADGAWSKVRPLVSAAKPTYAGVSFIETNLLGGEACHEASRDAVGAGTTMAVAPGQGILTHRGADGTLHTYTALTRPQAWFASLDRDDPGRVLAAVAGEFSGWAPHLVALAARSDTPPRVRAIHTLPVEHRWDRTPGVTLAGDAAHLMSPFSGEGANLALLDGAELGRALAAHRSRTETALDRYEAGLFPRSARAAGAAAANLDRFFGADAPRSVVALFSP